MLGHMREAILEATEIFNGPFKNDLLNLKFHKRKLLEATSM
jgi:hypothetical protein